MATVGMTTGGIATQVVVVQAPQPPVKKSPVQPLWIAILVFGALTFILSIYGLSALATFCSGPDRLSGCTDVAFRFYGTGLICGIVLCIAASVSLYALSQSQWEKLITPTNDNPQAIDDRNRVLLMLDISFHVAWLSGTALFIWGVGFLLVFNIFIFIAIILFLPCCCGVIVGILVWINCCCCQRQMMMKVRNPVTAQPAVAMMPPMQPVAVQYGQPQYGQPQYGQPQYGQPMMMAQGQPMMMAQGQPMMMAPGQPVMGQPVMGQPMQQQPMQQP
jgi:hypothetical protein